MSESGFNRKVLKLLQFYLDERSQLVKYNSITSKFIDSKNGVPQEPVLGALLSLIYINDFHYYVKQRKDMFFADETMLCFVGWNKYKEQNTA